MLAITIVDIISIMDMEVEVEEEVEAEEADMEIISIMEKLFIDTFMRVK